MKKQINGESISSRRIPIRPTRLAFIESLDPGTASRAAVLTFGLLGSVGCHRSVEVATLVSTEPGVDVESSELGTSAEETQTSAGSSSFAATSSAADAAACIVTACRGRVLTCGDCVDNDEDGLVDAVDPDCWGPCHDSEQTWGSRQVCSNESCYFDRDCGLGNDLGCEVNTPNGCDCHGCCSVAERNEPILLSTRDALGEPTCGAATVRDAALCQSCTIDESCFNACEPFETCFGP